MEKIYMENNQNQKQTQQTKKTFNMLNVTVGLSFAIAFIAVASILLVVAFKPSYSYEKLTKLPTKVKTLEPNKYLIGDAATVRDATFLFELQYELDGQTQTGRGICLESQVNYGTGDLDQDKEIDDVGLIYLIEKLDKISEDIENDYDQNDKFGCRDGEGYTCSKDDISAWVRQNAIWGYQAKKLGSTDISKYGQIDEPNADYYYDYNGAKNSSVVKNARQTNQTETYTCPNGCKWFEKYGVSDAVEEALTKTGSLNNVAITVSVINEVNEEGQSVQWVEAGDFYRTGKITVETIGSSNSSASAKLDGIDKAKLYGCPASGDCKEISDLSNVNLTSYNHFRIYVPKDVVTEEKQSVTVSFNYKFDLLSGYYYTETGYQTVTILGTIPKEVSDGETFEIVKAPDTATDISGTIYVVGLIVLLSGLGILYINVRKQKTQTQQ